MANNKTFWRGAFVGWLLILILSPFLPVLGPLIGGFVAGIMARGGFWNGAKAGAVAGMFGALVVSIALILGGTLLLGGLGFLASLGIGILLLAASLYTAILGFLGGGIGGYFSG